MEAKLINKSQVKKAIKVKGFLGNLLASMAMKLIGAEEINKVYSKISEYQGIEFADKVLQSFNVTCDFIPDELENLPKEGPFIIVSNHPFGAIDGIMLLSLIGKQRSDLKILTNFLLSYIPNLTEFFFPVNPFTDKPGMRSSLKGLRLAKEHLLNGGVLGLFPSGEVSSNGNKENVVKDIEWQLSVIKLIKSAEVPVVPVYFDGANSKFFHIVGKINPMLRTIRLPRELTNKKNTTIPLRIGKPILPSEINEFINLKDLGKYLWNRSYALQGNIEDGVDGNALSNINNYTIPLSQPIKEDILKKEIESIRDSLLFSVKHYECYLADYNNIPNLIKEIGRCREEAFRAVGEGTNKEMDIDDYDCYYKHLILWNKEDNKVIGAYRLGFGEEIINKYGLEGLYVNTLFRYKRDFIPYLKSSIELGRSFVAQDYQKDPLSLMLLIKGLMYTVIKYPNIRYLIGPVSISSWYPLFYRSLMIYYLNEKQTISEFKDFVSPKTPFVPNYCKVDVVSLLEHKIDSLERFDRFIYKLSNNKYKLPTLLKKYIKINAKLLSFNVDPDFNYCVDGLIMLDLEDVPKQEIDSLSKEFEDKDKVYKRFGIEYEIL